MRARLLVRTAAPGATIQDRGRSGLRHLGVSRAGALDAEALAVGNRLLGNAPEAAGIEVVLGGMSLQAAGTVWICLTGADMGARVDGHPIDRFTPTRLTDGALLSVGTAADGLRCYVTVRGGVDAPIVLASRSTDTLAHLGPEPLRSGDALAIGSACLSPIPPNDARPWGELIGDELTVRVLPGPRADMFTDAAWTALTTASWQVTSDADRVGIRLEGPPLERRAQGELPSEGMVPGALQVPHAGRPVILLADGPVTGGYPVIGVIASSDLDRLAQVRPGTRLRLRP